MRKVQPLVTQLSEGSTNVVEEFESEEEDVVGTKHIYVNDIRHIYFVET